jgi:uncharacterized Tic20 family protein
MENLGPTAPLPPGGPSSQPPHAGSGQLSGPGSPTAEERNFAVLAHLGAFAICLFPLGHVLAPLLVWLFRRQSPFTERHAREALNFQLSVTGYALVSALLAFFLIGFFLLAALIVFDVACAVAAARRASLGEDYEYPLSIRLIS